MAKTTKYSGTQTEKNLEAAFAGESQARNKYTYFASVAKKQGFEQIADLFLKTADNEKEHAKMWFKELEGIGDTAANLAAAAATLVTLIVTWVRYGKPDISMTMNGALAGLVAITASCDVVNDYEALFIGAVAGVVVVFAVEFFDKVVKIDDPVGAISVHGVCGALGTLFTGIFGEGCSFITQLIGFVAVAAYTLILAFILFFVLKKTIGLRVTEKEEIDGLDMHEHGCSAYANFHFHNDK